MEVWNDFLDKDGNTSTEEAPMKLEYLITGDSVILNVEALCRSELNSSLSGIKNVEFDIRSNNMTYPLNFTEGQQLEPMNTKMKGIISGSLRFGLL